jgi:hypothetical protein
MRISPASTVDISGAQITDVSQSSQFLEKGFIDADYQGHTQPSFASLPVSGSLATFTCLLLPRENSIKFSDVVDLLTATAIGHIHNGESFVLERSDTQQWSP